MITYPGDVSDTETLRWSGYFIFASMAGQQSGNHFMAVTNGLDNLPELGGKVLREDAQNLGILASR
jgi:hypothetical protein